MRLKFDKDNLYELKNISKAILTQKSQKKVVSFFDSILADKIAPPVKEVWK